MTYENLQAELETCWAPDDGAFWHLRQGTFDMRRFERLLRTLRDTRVDYDATLPRRLVSLLWYAPLFMQWQADRVRECGGDVQTLLTMTSKVTNEVERILGVP